MRQDNFDKKIKDIFGSMNDADQVEALGKKEDIWQQVHSEKDEKRRKSWLLIILLGSLLFTAGWFLGNINNTPAEITLVEQDNRMSVKTNKLINAQFKTQLNFKEQQLDSLLIANRIMSEKLNAIANDTDSGREREKKVKTFYKRDTIYITEIKVQQQVVEKIIKDTILLEMPIIEAVQPAMAEANVEEPEKSESSDQAASSSETRTSIQFNFSESNLRDK